MIITTQKPLDEVLDYITPYSSILIAGCDGCTQPPRGLREAKTLSQLLELGSKLRNEDFEFEVTTTAKQCDSYLTASMLKPQMDGVEAVLSLACGAGVQTLANLFPELPIFPAQNTHFMGAEEREGSILEERCAGCGDCLLAQTGGICPVARCSKGLLNGACGGAKDGKCELDPERDCAWVLIYEQLKKQGKLELLKEFRPPRDYQLSGWRVTL
ncbi:methylenetetrahydrofolate reductase C-terminal domain-containing protein [Chloroflexota bacterium]